jgi:multiple sugar transport system ATP-binding protein
VPLPAALAAAVARAKPTEVVVGVRPEHLVVDPAGVVPATVTVIESLGHERHVICRLEDSALIIVREAADVTPPKEGESVRLVADPDHLHVFDAVSGERIGVGTS